MGGINRCDFYVQVPVSVLRTDPGRLINGRQRGVIQY